MSAETERQKYIRLSMLLTLGCGIAYMATVVLRVSGYMTSIGVRIAFSVLVLTYIIGWKLLRRKINTLFYLLPADEQMRLRRQTKQQLLMQIRKTKRWMKWLPFGLILGLVTQWHYGTKWRLAVVGIFLSCLVGAYFYLRAINRSLQRLDGALMQHPTGGMNVR